MKEYSVFNIATGRIVRSGSCQPITFATQAGAGEGVIEGAYDPDLFDVVNGIAVARTFTPQEEAEQLALAKTRAATQVNHYTGEARKKYITAVPGQESVYGEKRKEAEAYVADNNISDAEIPHVVRSVGKDGVDKAQVAQVFLNMAALWKSKSADIEDYRLQAQIDILAATDIASVDGIVVQFRLDVDSV